VTDPRDEIDTWLQREVTPMYPPPGSFDRIRRRARSRKRRQALLAAAGCAVLAAGLAGAPHLVSELHHGGHTPPVAVGRSPSGTQPSATHARNGSGPSTATTHAGQIRARSTLNRMLTGPPDHFRPTSVTFVGTGTNDGLVGAVIGQAGTPGHCATKYCTSLAGTTNYGGSWRGVSAPVAPGPDKLAGVSLLRFANDLDGWAFGPALYETTGGGWPWHRVNTHGKTVTDLEADGSSALAVFASCSGSGSYFAKDCTSFSLYSGDAGSTTWTPVDVPAGYQQMSTSTASAATLVIAGGTKAYLLTPSGAVLSGPVTGGKWTVAGQAPSGCLPGPAQADGQPTGAQLASGQNRAGEDRLLLDCDTTGSTSKTVLYSSPNGKQWTALGSAVQHFGTVTSLTTASAGQVLLATTSTICYSANGITWQDASFGQSGPPPGGFSYVGLTTAKKGVAVPADASLGEIYVTRDGGLTWRASPIKG
jgi:hypothetical protein